jgi:hypothetical protein
MHILFNEKFRNQVAKTAYDSWMSNGQYIMNQQLFLKMLEFILHFYPR